MRASKVFVVPASAVVNMLILLLASGCGPEPGQGTAPTVRVDSVTSVARDLLLERPRAIDLVGSDRLVVADTRAVYLLGDDLKSAAAEVVQLGRVGDGPGEYRRVDAIAGDSSSVVVLDGRGRRGMRFSEDGSLLDSWSIAGASSTATPTLSGSEAHVRRRTIVAEFRTGVIRKEEPDPHELVRYDPDTNRREVLWTWPGTRWVDLDGGMNVPATPADDRPASAVSRRHPWAAVAVDRSPCVALLSIEVETPSPREICFPWGPVVMEPPDIDSEDLEGLADPARQMLEGLAEAQNYEGVADAVQDLVFDGQACLWVRVATKESYNAMLLALLPHLRPSHYEWRVIDPVSGEVVRALELPSGFGPQVRRDSTLFGFQTDSFNAQWLATVTVPATVCDG